MLPMRLVAYVTLEGNVVNVLVNVITKWESRIDILNDLFFCCNS